MPAGDPLFANERASGIQDDLRQQIADLLLERVDQITADTVAIFPYSGVETLDADYCRRVGLHLAQLLTFAVRDGRVDRRGNLIADLHRVVIDRALSIERLFTFAYLTDCSQIPQSSWPLLTGVRTLVLDALRDRPHPTHFSVSEALEVVARLSPDRAYFTHICHDLPHAETCARLPPGVELAYDGLVLEVP